jgi:hypothetical protein
MNCFTDGERGGIVGNPWGFRMNVGLQDGLIELKHVDRMEQAVWLYLWCVKCQTKRNGGVFVLGGMPITYELIARRSGFPVRRVRRWLDRLRSFHYVEVTYLNYMKLRIEITKAKKWTPKQTQLFDHSTGSTRTTDGQGLGPQTVKGSTIDGQPKQKCSLRNSRSERAPLPPNEKRVGGFRRPRRLTEGQRMAQVGRGPEVPARVVRFCKCGFADTVHRMKNKATQRLHWPKFNCTEFVEDHGDENIGSGAGSGSASGGEKNDGAAVDAGTVGRSEAEKGGANETRPSLSDFPTIKGMIQ